MSKFSQYFSSVCLLFTIAIFGSTVSHAQDTTYGEARELIYPTLNKIVLPFEPITISMESDRKFLYLKETQELDRLITHMKVKKDMIVEVVCVGPSHAEDLAQQRTTIIRGYILDNGGDVDRVRFKTDDDNQYQVVIRAIEDV